MSKYYASEDYNYKEEVKPKSWWDYVKEFLLKWIKRVGLGSSQLLGLLIVAGAAALIWLVIIITNTPVKGLFYFSKNSALVSIPLKAESDINNPELESMLNLFVKHKAFRHAQHLHRVHAGTNQHAGHVGGTGEVVCDDAENHASALAAGAGEGSSMPASCA